MQGVDTGSVEDLCAAGDARSGNENGMFDGVVFDSIAYGGKENHLADGDRGLVMCFLVAEGPRHAATSGRDDMDLGVGGQV